MGNAYAFPIVFLHIFLKKDKDVQVENNNNMFLTEFDVATLSHETQMLKAFIPFMDTSQQKSFALFIRVFELIKTMDFYNHITEPSPLRRKNCGKKEIFEEMKNFCPKKDREILDIMANMDNITEYYNMFQAMNSPKKDNSQSDILKNFLSPEQQKMYESYQNILNF